MEKYKEKVYSFLISFQENENSFKYIIVPLCAILIISIGVLIFSNGNEHILKGEKTLGHYQIKKIVSTTPFVIDLFEIESSSLISNYKVSNVCPYPIEGLPQDTFVFFRFNNLNTKTMESFYTYDGTYESFCIKNKKNLNENGEYESEPKQPKQ